MNFEPENLYHIYNQGNNRQKIFFTRENYLFFLNKIKMHILPHADIVAWCLMPNHFHLMIYVKDVSVSIAADSIQGVTSSHPLNMQIAPPTIKVDSLLFRNKFTGRIWNNKEHLSL